MLLDTASMYFRAFFGVPEILAPDGTTPVNAVRGLLDFITRLVDEYRPTDLVCCWDDDWRPQWRVDLVPTYKAHRVEEEVETAPDVEEVPDPLQVQVPIIRDVLAAYGIKVVGAPEAEADDVIGTLAYDEANDPVIVVSGDRDLLQVVADDPVPVRVLYVGRGLAKAEMMGPVEVAEKYGVPVERAGIGYAEMSMLRGDPSDGLPGVAGIGEKTAAKLITEYGSLDALEAAAADPSSSVPTRSRKALLASVEYLQAARTVVSVRTDAETIDSGSDILPAEPADPAALAELVEELGMGASVGRLAKALGWPQAG